MGQNQAKELNQSPKANYHPEVEVVQEKIFEPHYGEVKIVKDKETEQLLILKETVVNTKQAYETELEALNNRIELRHPNVAEIVGYNAKDQQNFCSTYYKLQVYIEVLENTLLTELENRISTQIPYNESEILLVADNLISGLTYFQSQGFAHGDIRPYNIFVQGNTYKLSDPSLSAHKGQHGLHLAIIQGQKSLLAPELVSQVPSSNFEIKSDKNKADVFSLGLTLLSLATLSNLEDLYDYQIGTINEQILNDKLVSIQYRYSPYTWDLLKSMVTINETERPDFVSLSNTLLPYQDQIRASAGLNYYNRTEGVKRGGVEETQTTYTLEMADDLEARIKAALERSEATFKAVSGKEASSITEPRGGELAKSYVSNTANVNAGIAGGYGTNEYGTTSYNYGTAASGVHQSGVNQVTTTQPLGTSGVNQGLAGSGVYRQATHDTVKRSAAPETLAQSNTYNSSYIPAGQTTTTYQYSHTTAAPAGEYTPGGSYNYSSTYVPNAAYGTTSNTGNLATSTYGTTPIASGAATAAYGTSTTPKAETTATPTGGAAYGTYGTSASGTYGASTTPKAETTYTPADYTTTGAAYGTYGTSASGTYGASTTPKAETTATPTAGDHTTAGAAYGTYGTTTSVAYGASTTPKAETTYTPVDYSTPAYSTYGTTTYGVSTTPKAQESTTTPTHTSGVYGTAGAAALGATLSGTYGASTTPKAQETTPSHVSGTYTPTAIYGTAASGTYKTQETTEVAGSHTPVAIQSTETETITTQVTAEGQVVETVVVETTTVETTVDGTTTVETTTVETVVEPAGEQSAGEQVVVEETIITTTIIEQPVVTEEQPAATEEQPAPVVEEEKGFFEKVKDAVEEAVDKVGDFAEEVVDKIKRKNSSSSSSSSDDDDLKARKKAKKEKKAAAAAAKAEEEHKEATTAETTVTEQPAATEEQPAATEEQPAATEQAAEEPAQEEVQEEKQGKKGKKGRKYKQY